MSKFIFGVIEMEVVVLYNELRIRVGIEVNSEVVTKVVE
jgi:hypothetical protein